MTEVCVSLCILPKGNQLATRKPASTIYKCFRVVVECAVFIVLSSTRLFVQMISLFQVLLKIGPYDCIIDVV